MSPGIRSAIAGDLKVGIAWNYNCMILHVLKKTFSRAEGSQHFLFGNFTIVVSICWNIVLPALQTIQASSHTYPCDLKDQFARRWLYQMPALLLLTAYFWVFPSGFCQVEPHIPKQSKRSHLAEYTCFAFSSSGHVSQTTVVKPCKTPAVPRPFKQLLSRLALKIRQVSISDRQQRRWDLPRESKLSNSAFNQANVLLQGKPS